MQKSKTRTTALLGVAHFLVDLTCHAVLSAAMYRYTDLPLLWSVILYNGLAFAFQLPVGALADLFSLTRSLSAIGCLLVAIAALLPGSLPICLVAGIGNACFHVGGGREALLLGEKCAAQIGMFVAPGAIGVFFGARLAGFPYVTGLVLPLILLLLAAAILLGGKKRLACLSREKKLQSPAVLFAVAGCMFLTVLLRAYFGTVIHYEFLSSFPLALLYTLCIFGGKFFGGVLADRFGAFRFSAYAQSLGTVLFVLSLSCPYLALPAVFLFNTTMAITAVTLYRLSPQLGGTMFGLTTLALYLGSLPKMLRLSTPFFTWWGVLLLGGLSAALLLFGLKLEGGGKCRA